MLDFRDGLNDYQSATVHALRAGAQGSRTSFLGFPGVLSAGGGESLLTDWLRRQWDRRERLRFSVAATERRVAPGVLVRVAGAQTEYLVGEVEEGLKRSVTARRIRRAPPAPWSAEDAARVGGGPASAGKPLVLLADLPLRTSADRPEDQLRVAARSKPWASQAVLASPDDSGFVTRSRFSRRATIGHLTRDLAAGAVGRIDHAHELTVALLEGELSGVSRARLLNGANAAALRAASGEWEVVQFADAEETEPSLWRLTGLLRAQLGTEDAMAAGIEAGAPFVLLDEAVRPAGLGADEIGLELNWRVGPVGRDISHGRFAARTAAGGMRALRPLSPVHLHGRRTGAGDLEITWIRRGRVDADSWQGEDIVLGEDSERYRVAIAPAGGNAVRTETVSQAAFTYTAEAMAADFASLPGVVDVMVSQMSGAVGAGTPAAATIALE